MTIEYFWLEAIWILALIFANGFFAASEIAVITMRKSRIDALLERGVKAAAVVARLKEDPDRFLATVQIGVTLTATPAHTIGGVPGGVVATVTPGATPVARLPSP